MAKDNKLAQIFAVRKDISGTDCLFSYSLNTIRKNSQ